MIHEWQTNEKGELLLLDKWANEGGKRVRVWLLEYKEIRIEFVDAGQSGEPAYESLTLTSYRSDDLAKALSRVFGPQ